MNKFSLINDRLSSEANSIEGFPFECFELELIIAHIEENDFFYTNSFTFKIKYNASGKK